MTKMLNISMTSSPHQVWCQQLSALMTNKFPLDWCEVCEAGPKSVYHPGEPEEGHSAPPRPALSSQSSSRPVGGGGGGGGGGGSGGGGDGGVLAGSRTLTCHLGEQIHSGEREQRQ
ncbi:hypothetical protein Pmani_007906 [Petrolisthes manimaculis]|uniref:Uncharacterized protein n=1 Tax=Petrolisthes manimaculis TaxID=1843537 RepID=A0AAE1Q7X7_9EUCA|nr:hypothetical protein Pmani_007906 [Petrolisthes manimaculis]